MKLIIVLLTLFCLYQGKTGPVNLPANAGCPKGWIRFRDRCYYISGGYETYHRAMAYCLERNSQLVPPITYDEQHDLNEFLVDHRTKCRTGNCAEYWIGVYYSNAGKWTTTKGFLFERNQCLYWARGFPNRTEGRCATMSYKGTRSTGYWRNTNCTRTLKFVCITCPNNFDYMPEINECLHFNPKREEWSKAQQTCAKFKKRARLVTIESAIKQDAVAGYIRSRLNKSSECDIGKRVWMGAQTSNPDECKTPFVWKPLGAAPIPLTYTNWVPGSPLCSYKKATCAGFSVSYRYRWQDEQCTSAFCYVCEF